MIFWAEATRQIGMGHLMECLAISDEMRSQGIPVEFVTDPYQPAASILEQRGVPFTLSPKSSANETICALAETHPDRTVLMHHRSASLNNQTSLKKYGFRLIVCDQLGGIEVSSDVLINCSDIPEWLHYSYSDTSPLCCFGPDYAVLRKEFEKYHRQSKTFPDDGFKVLVTMGGVDRTGATIRIIDALASSDISSSFTVILGRGFYHWDSLKQSGSFQDSRFQFLHNVSDMENQMFNSDVVICSGGFTLYEMACVGVPGLVLWEDPHEEILGRYFEAKGTVLVVGNGMKSNKSLIRSSVEKLLSNKTKLIQMSKKGKALVDCKGIDRVCQAIALPNHKS